MNIFDKYYKKYDKWYDRNEKVFLSEIEAIKKFRPQGTGVEIGTGTGRFAQALNIKYGVDTSLNMLLLARKRGIQTFHADGENMPFENEFFDFALIIASLSFMQNPLAVFKETRRVLKSGGLLISGIIRRESAWGNYYLAKKSPIYSQARFFSPQETIDLYDKSGFSYIKSYQTLFTSPDKFTEKQKPLRGHDRGGFIALAGRK